MKIKPITLASLLLIGCGSTPTTVNPESRHREVPGTPFTEARTNLIEIRSAGYFDYCSEYPIVVQDSAIILGETDGRTYVLASDRVGDIIDITRRAFNPDAELIDERTYLLDGNLDLSVINVNHEEEYSLLRINENLIFPSVVVGDSADLRPGNKVHVLGHSVSQPFQVAGMVVNPRHYENVEIDENEFLYRSPDFSRGAPIFTEDAYGNVYLVGMHIEHLPEENINRAITIDSILENLSERGIKVEVDQATRVDYVDNL